MEISRRANRFAAVGAGLVSLLALSTACAGQLQIEDMSVQGPPANFDMSSRLMTSGKRMKVSVEVPGVGRAALPHFNGTFFYRHDRPDATSATLLLRTDGLADVEGALAQELSDALDFDQHPFLSFQSASAQVTPDGLALHGTLIAKTEATQATLLIAGAGKVALNDKNESFLEAKGTIRVATTDLGLGHLGERLDIHLELFLFNYTRASAVATGIDPAALDRSPPVLPRDAEALSNAGWYLMLEQRYPEAIEAFDRSIEASPQNVSAYFRRGDAYVFNGDYGKAMGTYTALRAFMPLQPHILELSKVLDDQRLTPESLQAAGERWHATQR